MSRAPALYLNGSAFIQGVCVFSDVQVQIGAGQWTCLLGASGVGKSTMLKLFAGLDEHIDFKGTFGATEGELSQRVTLMAQDDLLLPWLNVIENVMIGARLRGEPPEPQRAKDVLEQVGLSQHLDKRPDALSGGQRQRVALARTLMEDRPIVLLDEPFSALDAMTRAQMQDLTAKLLQRRTVLLVTHDPLEAARMGDQILILSHNKVTNADVPQGACPRAVDASDVLEIQAKLLNDLRKRQGGANV